MSEGGMSLAEILGSLDHPIIDADAHLQEFTSFARDEVLDRIRSHGGPQMADRLDQVSNAPMTIEDFMMREWLPLTVEQRRDEWMACPAWWGQPTTTRDRATSYLPSLYYERLEEVGIDFAVLYPSYSLSSPSIDDDDLRRITCRVYNEIASDLYSKYSDRMTPAAIIPMTTPDEAVAELEYAVSTLSSKVVVFPHVRRPIPKIAREHPELGHYAERLDTFGIDSDYDYDPVWRKCIELGVAVSMHASEQNWGSRRSYSRYSYNHMGAFSSASDSLCKSIFMGGVTRRFPELNFVFLEGGVSWACTLLSDMVGHWKKRGGDNIQFLNPDRIDQAEMARLVTEYAPERFSERVDEMVSFFARATHSPEELDDWAQCKIETVEDIKSLFVDPFYFGCEADDPMNSLAFNKGISPFATTLKIVFGSDIGHWDVEDVSDVVREAHELVEDGLITDDEFRQFTFENAAHLYGDGNPNFFRGTAVESSVAELKQSSASSAK
jgi:predicted TIM-barrel fold metal-dependent hydrolase